MSPKIIVLSKLSIKITWLFLSRSMNIFFRLLYGLLIVQKWLLILWFANFYFHNYFFDQTDHKNCWISFFSISFQFNFFFNINIYIYYLLMMKKFLKNIFKYVMHQKFWFFKINFLVELAIKDCWLLFNEFYLPFSINWLTKTTNYRYIFSTLNKTFLTVYLFFFAIASNFSDVVQRCTTFSSSCPHDTIHIRETERAWRAEREREERI